MGHRKPARVRDEARRLATPAVETEIAGDSHPIAPYSRRQVTDCGAPLGESFGIKLHLLATCRKEAVEMGEYGALGFVVSS